MQTLLAFIGALSASILVFEIVTAIRWRGFRRRRLSGVSPEDQGSAPRRSTWEALLLAIFPQRFAPLESAKEYANVTSLLRRSGYPYDTPGEFFAAAMHTFTLHLLAGGLLAGAMAALGMAAAAPVLALIFVALGLRRPYVHLKAIARRRAGLTRNNMLVGLSTLSSLLSAGVGVQEAMRRTADLGGPFCNLLGLLVARMEIEDFAKAMAVTRAHMPDPADIELGLFLRDVEDYFVHNRPLLASVQGLQGAVHRGVVEATEARAALVKQRAGLFGIFAIVGLVLTMIAPIL